MSYRSTIVQVEEFLASNVWKDMLEELELWRKSAEAGYPKCVTMKQLGAVNGRLEAIAYLERLPDELLRTLQLQATNKKEGLEDEADTQ